MNHIIELLISYVENTISPINFEMQLAKKLDDFEHYCASVEADYFFETIIHANYRDIETQLAVHDEICSFLTDNKIIFTASKELRAVVKKIKKILPKYLPMNAKVCQYIIDEILSKEPETLTEQQLESWRQRQIKTLFPLTCVKSKSPRWLDEPEWPFYNGKPMHFIGQMLAENPEYKTYYYIFESPQGGQEIIVQQR